MSYPWILHRFEPSNSDKKQTDSTNT